MKKLMTTAAVCAALLTPLVTRADDREDLDKVASSLNEQGRTTEGRTHVLDAISKETGVPVATLEAQKTKTGLGYGELFIANSLASASGKTFDEIVALKSAGKGWGEISQSLGVKLGEVVGKARRASEAAGHAADNGGKHGPSSDPREGGPHAPGTPGGPGGGHGRGR